MINALICSQNSGRLVALCINGGELTDLKLQFDLDRQFFNRTNNAIYSFIFMYVRDVLRL